MRTPFRPPVSVAGSTSTFTPAPRSLATTPGFVPVAKLSAVPITRSGFRAMMPSAGSCAQWPTLGILFGGYVPVTSVPTMVPCLPRR